MWGLTGEVYGECEVESNFSEKPHAKDVVMFLKQRMHSDEWSQAPFVFAPAVRMQRLDGCWPEPTVPRAIMSGDMVKEFEKTIAKVTAAPWNLIECGQYIKDLIEQSGTLAKPTRAKLLDLTLKMTAEKEAALGIGEANVDRLDPNVFEPSKAAAVKVMPTKPKPAAKKFKAQRRLQVQDSDASVVMLPATPSNIPKEPEIPATQQSLPSDLEIPATQQSLPSDQSEVELPLPLPESDVPEGPRVPMKRPASRTSLKQQPPMKRPASQTSLKRPAAAVEPDESDMGDSKPEGQPKPKGQPKAKATSGYMPSTTASFFKLKKGFGIEIPTGKNIQLGCVKCRKSHVGCKDCRMAKGFELDEVTKVWKYVG